MTSTRWLALIVALTFALPANAQFRKTYLTERGQTVAESTPTEVASCEIVYRWDRCRSSRRLLSTLSGRSEQRRLNCVAASRNVSARRGATHFILQGPVFTGYRCGSPYEAVPDAPPGPAPAPVRDEQVAERARYKEIGFVAWGGVCTGVEELFDDTCASRGTSYERVSCEEARAAALSAGERVYYQPAVDRQIEYDGKTRTFTVQFKGVLGRLGGQRYLTAGPLVVPRRGTTAEALADAAQPFGQLTVPVGEIKLPARFERDLLVEALVRPKAVHSPARRNPAQLSALEAEVVALRAYLPDLSWGAVIVPAPKEIPSYRCPPLEAPTSP